MPHPMSAPSGPQTKGFQKAFLLGNWRWSGSTNTAHVGTMNKPISRNVSNMNPEGNRLDFPKETLMQK